MRTDKQTDRQTHMTWLAVSFRNLVNEPKTGKSRSAASFGQMKKRSTLYTDICNGTVPDLPE